MVQYTGKSIFIMKKLQNLLRKTIGVQVSLQDPLVFQKLITAGEQTEDEQVWALVSALQQECRKERTKDQEELQALPLTEKKTRQMPGQSGVLASQQSASLDAQICSVLANYCGPISRFLFRQSWEQLNCKDIYQDFDRLVFHLSAEITDKNERVEFVEKCQQLV
jgi:hypothetical protein